MCKTDTVSVKKLTHSGYAADAWKEGRLESPKLIVATPRDAVEFPRAHAHAILHSYRHNSFRCTLFNGVDVSLRIS